MKEECLRRFAAIFAVLVFLSGNDARVYINPQNDYHNDDSFFDLEKDFYQESSKLPSNDLAPYRSNDKRFVGAALLGIAAISAGFDIYKQERGCADSNPKIVGYVEEANRLTKIAKKMRDDINIAWNPIVDAEGYFSKCGAEITILRTHIAKLDSLKADTVQLLDQSFFSKMDLAKREIENDIVNNNDTSYVDPNVYLAKFFTKTAYILTLSLKLGPIGLFLGAKLLGPYISRAISKAVAKSFATNNPGLIARGIKNFQEKGLFPNSRAKIKATFKTYVSSPLKARFKALPLKVQNGLKIVGKGIKFLAKGAIVGVFLAYEIYNGWKFFEDCDRKEREAKQNVVDINDSIQNMTIINKKMNAFYTELVHNYGYLFGNLTSDNAMELVNETYHTTINSQYQNKTIEQNALDIKNYYDNIKSAKTGPNKYDFAKVERLLKLLNSAFQKTSFKLECYRRKVLIIASITRDCAKGIGTGDSLWVEAKALEGSVLKECVEKDRYLTKAGVLETIRGVMEAQQKSPICLRNDPGKQTSVCNAWRAYKTNAQIMAIDVHKGLTAADISHFVSKCSPADVTGTYETSICDRKSKGIALAAVKSEFNRHNAAQIENVYNNVCKLSTAQKQLICADKEKHHRLNVVQAKYPTYNEVPAVYSACPPNQGKMCLLYLYVSKDPDFPVYNNDTIIYGRQAIVDALEKCKALGDAPEKNAFDMLADSVKASEEEESNDVDAVIESALQHINKVKVCRDLKNYGPSYAEIVDPVTPKLLVILKPMCPTILAEAALPGEVPMPGMY